MHAPDGTAFRLFSVQEYPRFGDATPARRYGVVVDERDAFWATFADTLALQSPEPDDGAEVVPLARATYRTVRRGWGLREHQGRECLVYVVEQLIAEHELHVPSRCGVRFVGDDSYWVLPAVELDIGPLASTA